MDGKDVEESVIQPYISSDLQNTETLSTPWAPVPVGTDAQLPIGMSDNVLRWSNGHQACPVLGISKLLILPPSIRDQSGHLGKLLVRIWALL